MVGPEITGKSKVAEVVHRYPRTEDVFRRWFDELPDGALEALAAAGDKDLQRLIDELNVAAALSDWETGRL